MRRPLGPGTAAGLVIAFGVALRLGYFLDRPSLWNDEALIALNVGGRSFAALLSPLDFAQVAPFPWLWLERSAFIVLGANEFALRFWPLVAGCVLLVLIYRLAREITPPGAAVLATLVAATAYPLVRYSGEVKQYTLAACVTAAVLLSALAVIRQPGDRRSWVRLSAAGALGTLVSFSAVFACAATLLAWATVVLRRRSAMGIRRWLISAALWLIAFAVAYPAARGSPATANYVQRFWEAAFLRPTSPDLAWRWNAAFRELTCTVNCWDGIFDRSWLALTLLAAGAASVGRRNGIAVTLLLAAPVVAPFAASVAGLYPVATRLLLFAAPAAVVLCAAGVWSACRVVANWSPALRPRLLAPWFVYPSAVMACVWVIGQKPIEPGKREELRPLVELLGQRSGAADPVYIFVRTIPSWVFYSTDWRSPDYQWLGWIDTVAGLGGPAFTNGPSRGARRRADAGYLQYPWRGHPVVLGTSTGMQARAWQGYDHAAPDLGWADAEAARLASVASGTSRAWLVLSDYDHLLFDEAAPLLDAIRQTGGGTEVVAETPGAELIAVRYAQGSAAIVAGSP